ncbi:superinfection immunity protein [Xylophilus rhododendri]|uniref:Superinfection immunity protein n=1 Tax=Xylophilus rhododendri TaxID=2697032 RepID=A0A857JDJ0_9BURK|nr:superinfection immunity protein [Xylophilus rhododendri]QHJ01708.1 superinfection immunity protein [Xylophilus rhododendri]
MVFVRLIALLFLVFYSYTTGMSVSASPSMAMHILFWVSLIALYLLPTYEAAKRRHPSLVPIALVDILLGWTVIGWVVAMVWAVRRAEVAVEAVGGGEENDPYVIVNEPSRYPANSAAESLKELAKLRAEGAISEEEYVAAKGRVLHAR